jgi:hypothetical protein
MKILFLLFEIVLVFGLLIYLFEIKFRETVYSIHESNYHLGLTSEDEPKFLIHKVELILGVEIVLSFIGKVGDEIGFDSYDEAKEHLKKIKNGEI